MKIKNLAICSILIGGTIFTGVTAYADEPTPLVYSTENIMVDKTPVSEKTTLRETLKGFEFLSKAAPSNTSRLKCSGGIVGQVKATATSSSSAKEDHILAKARIYKSGALISQKTDIQKKSSYAGIAANHPDGYYGGSTAYGNHEYKLSGYKDVYHETTARW